MTQDQQNVQSSAVGVECAEVEPKAPGFDGVLLKVGDQSSRSSGSSASSTLATTAKRPSWAQSLPAGCSNFSWWEE